MIALFWGIKQKSILITFVKLVLDKKKAKFSLKNQLGSVDFAPKRNGNEFGGEIKKNNDYGVGGSSSVDFFGGGGSVARSRSRSGLMSKSSRAHRTRSVPEFGENRRMPDFDENRDYQMNEMNQMNERNSRTKMQPNHFFVTNNNHKSRTKTRTKSMGKLNVVKKKKNKKKLFKKIGVWCFRKSKKQPILGYFI